MLTRLLGRVGFRTGVLAAASTAFVLFAAAAQRNAAGERPVGSQAPAQATPAQTPATAGAPSPAADGGVPFGASKLPNNLFGKPFTETKLEFPPESILSALAEVRAARMRIFIILVGASQKFYQNADGTFNLAMWNARLDRFRGIDLSPFIRDGTIIGHQLISEAKARGQWGGAVIPNDVLDGMARRSKELWPTMATMLRTDPTDLELHAAGYKTPLPGWKWKYLDTASARYLVRKGSVEKFAADEQASADRQQLGLIVGLNVFSGGDGSSGIHSPHEGKWAMSPDELRRYGSQLLNRTKPCAFEMWRYESSNTEFANFMYFRRPEIMAAMTELAALAARIPARSCFGGQQHDQ